MIDETTSPEVDILSRSDKLLYAFDMDYDENGKDAQIVFSVDNDKFVVLPSFQISYNSKNNVERIYFIPRVGLAAAWNRQDGTSVTFNLIAKVTRNLYYLKQISTFYPIAGSRKASK